MKHHFNSEQLSWLRDAAGRMLFILCKDKLVERGLVRQVSKLMYKFTPNARAVYLNRKERDLLTTVTNARLNSLIKQHSVSSEIDSLQSIINVLEGAENEAT